MYWKREKNKKWNHFYFSNSPPRTKMGAKISKNTDIHIYVYIKKVWEEENSSFRWHRLGPTYLHSQREITFNKKYVSLKKLSITYLSPPHDCLHRVCQANSCHDVMLFLYIHYSLYIAISKTCSGKKNCSPTGTFLFWCLLFSWKKSFECKL